MPRKSAAGHARLAKKTLVLDNGAYTIKAGLVPLDGSTEPECHLIPNCIAKGVGSKVYVGNQLSRCVDFAEMSFRRPVQKGCLVSWEAEREIWEQSFFDDGALLQCDPKETNLLLTEASNVPTALQANTDQMVFEEFEFAAYRRSVGPSLNCFHETTTIFGDPPRWPETEVHPAECLLVIDSGYSFTTVTPLYKGKVLEQAVRRLDIGGKFLTNFLKDTISIRQMDVREETYMINLMKEDVSFVAEDFRKSIEATRDLDRSVVVDYVMPDYTSRFRGEIREHDPAIKRKMTKLGAVTNAQGVQEYIATLGNERFSGPELLFRPDDVGLKQAGLPQLVYQSLSCLPTGLWNAMTANILVVGGNAKISGFTDRLRAEIRQIMPVECTVRVNTFEDPVTSTWKGGARLASNPKALQQVLVTKQEYDENGPAWLSKRFAHDGVA